jgi:menaquinol-cytochrome c reductase iron-sulfur subunit
LSNEPKKEKKEVSRRQFLAYTLGGTGGFLAATMIVPMVRFAVDPLLQDKGDSEFVKVIALDQISEEPVSVPFKVLQKDGWVEEEVELTAWITKNPNGEVQALSPICKHLGCTVNWNIEKKYPNQYYCPCHGAHYEKNGKNLAIATAPLDEYVVKIQDNYVYLGNLGPNTKVTT